MNRCAASWFELNLSAPDNNVSACCFYAGEKDEWSDQPKGLDEYWNSPAMRAVRKLQSNPAPPKNHGCSSCHLYQNLAPGYEMYDFSPESPPPGISERQAANWRLAKAEYLAEIDLVSCSPMRVYANFGFACNISCNMCHQVPRRVDNRRQISADQLLSWGPDLEKALEVIVIGGEPFVIPQAVKFIRRFIADEKRYDSVQLAIATNGTVLHKHWATLRRKRRLRFAISLDGVGDAFERVRLGGKWNDVESNILRILEARDSDRPDWVITTSSNIQKSTLRDLPAFARWHTRHGLGTFFSDFISAPGVEDTYHQENFLQNPQLLADIPEWRDYFDEAASIYAKAGQRPEVDWLNHFKLRVEEAAASSADGIEASRRRRMRNDWVRQREALDNNNKASVDWSGTFNAQPALDRGPIPLGVRQGMQAFLATRLGDRMTTSYVGLQTSPEGGSFRVRLHWPRYDTSDEITRRAHVIVEQQYGSEVPVFRENLEFGIGTDLILTGDLAPDTQALRLIFTPVGEEVTLLPKIVEIDFDPATSRVEWPPKPLELERVHPVTRGLEKLKALVGRRKIVSKVSSNDRAG